MGPPLRMDVNLQPAEGCEYERASPEGDSIIGV